MKQFTEAPELLDIVSNTEIRAIQKDVLCPTTDDVDTFKELAEAQVTQIAVVLHIC